MGIDWSKIAIVAVLFVSLGAAAAEPSRFERVDVGGPLDVFVWRDVVNVFVLRSGQSAILVGLGDGSVLDSLGELGIRQLDWVLLTQHHREHCLGHRKLAAWQAKIAASRAGARPAGAAHRFPQAAPVAGRCLYRPRGQLRASARRAGDVDRGFQRMDTFTWRDHEFWCLETAGNSPGGMSYLLKTPDGWIAFSGGVMVSGAKMRNWFDTEWDYGFAKGLYTLIESVSLLTSFEPVLLLPSHGPVIREPVAELQRYQRSCGGWLGCTSAATPSRRLPGPTRTRFPVPAWCRISGRRRRTSSNSRGRTTRPTRSS
jgi:glyoxylase-like metal-dependent hydrolase (beta-lactamase superfamily II)